MQRDDFIKMNVCFLWYDIEGDICESLRLNKLGQTEHNILENIDFEEIINYSESENPENLIRQIVFKHRQEAYESSHWLTYMLNGWNLFHPNQTLMAEDINSFMREFPIENAKQWFRDKIELKSERDPILSRWEILDI